MPRNARRAAEHTESATAVVMIPDYCINSKSPTVGWHPWAASIQPRKDTQTEIVQPAKAKDQKTEQEGEGGCVAAGFVEVVMDSDE